MDSRAVDTHGCVYLPLYHIKKGLVRQFIIDVLNFFSR